MSIECNEYRNPGQRFATPNKPCPILKAVVELQGGVSSEIANEVEKCADTRNFLERMTTVSPKSIACPAATLMLAAMTNAEASM